MAPTDRLTTGGTAPVTRDLQAVIDVAAGSVAPQQLEDGAVYAVTVPAGAAVHVIDRDLDVFRPNPRRKTGRFTLHDAPSFVAYSLKHMLPASEFYADLATREVVAVYNAHGSVEPWTAPDPIDPSRDAPSASGIDGQTFTVESDAGWGDHRAELELRNTVAWNTWLKYDGKLLEQIEFSELVEARVIDFRAEEGTPSGAEMLELAQHFDATTQAAFESAQVLANGRRNLVYRETVNARAGEQGQIEIPATFVLAVAPFEGGETYRLPARFRYRMGGGHLKLGYVLERPEDVLRDAFLGVVSSIEAGVDRTVMRGVPA